MKDLTVFDGKLFVLIPKMYEDNVDMRTIYRYLKEENGVKKQGLLRALSSISASVKYHYQQDNGRNSSELDVDPLGKIFVLHSEDGGIQTIKVLLNKHTYTQIHKHMYT